MKSLAAAEADFRAEDRNVIQDFWASDLSDFYESYRFRWVRRDRHAPDVRGEETLTLRMFAAWPGQTYTLPSKDIAAEYTMATPSKGQGARAVELRGTVSVVRDGRVWLDLTARMERLDLPGVEFDETVRGLFPLTR